MFLDQLDVDWPITESVVHSQDEFDSVGVCIHNLLVDDSDEFATMGFQQFWLESFKGSALSPESFV